MPLDGFGYNDVELISLFSISNGLAINLAYGFAVEQSDV